MADEQRPELPSSVELAWGRRASSGRGPRPALNVERIVDAAVRVANKEGLDAVSMNRVATELGSSPMALYRHVSSKDELLMLMTDLPLESPPRFTSDDWRERLRTWAWAHREVFQRYPWMVRVPIGGPPITPNNVAWFEAGLEALAGTALAEGEKVGAVLLVSTHVRSDVQLNADIRAAEANTDRAMVLANYGAFLRELTTADDHPALHRALQEGVFDDEDTDSTDEDFEFGLQTIIAGLEALMRGRDDD